MEVQVKIEFQQLVKIVRSLPSDKLKKLKAEIEKKTIDNESDSSLETLLLNGPVTTSGQLATIKKNRKSINQWRASE